MIDFISFSRISYFSFLVYIRLILFHSLILDNLACYPVDPIAKCGISTEAKLYHLIYEMGANCFPLQIIKLCYILLTSVA
jgi:hypothetical protein